MLVIFCTAFFDFGTFSVTYTQSAPVAAAIALQKLAGKKFSSSNAVEFSLTDVCDTMGWDSALIKRELKSLEWTHDHTGKPRLYFSVLF